MKQWLPQVVVSIMLLWALYPSNPYDYYIFLRIACFALFGWLAFKMYKKGENTTWVWVFGITALIYNPMLRIHLNRMTWEVMNILTVILALISIHLVTKKH